MSISILVLSVNETETILLIESDINQAILGSNNPQGQYVYKHRVQGLTRGESRGIRGDLGPPLTTKNEAPAPKFYKIEAPEWQF